MMRILVCGANGFIGKAVADRLALAGHSILRGVRQPQRDGEIAVDFSRDTSVTDWTAKLAGIEVVVNAVGIIVERRGQRFDNVHRRGPSALFAACQAAGVKRVLQISALGADCGNTPYFTSKRAADDFLMSLPVGWQVVRPALVYGAHGASAAFFRLLSSLPLVFLPGGGQQLLQPIHIDDLTAVVTRLIDPATPAHQCIELVGQRPVQYREMLRTYRSAMALSPAVEIGIPASTMGLAAKAAGRIPGALLTPDTWKMLQAGSTGNADDTTRLLGHPPRSLEDFVSPDEAPLMRHEALAAWRNPLLRAVLAFVWIATGLLTLFMYPVSASLALLEHTGLTGNAALFSLYGAVVLDLALGIATGLFPGRRLWLFQIATIVVYTAIIAVALPEFLVHPFGPVIKNLPILGILMILVSEETQP